MQKEFNLRLLSHYYVYFKEFILFQASSETVEGNNMSTINYYRENDLKLPSNSVTKGATLEKIEPVYPTQTTLSRIMLDRILMTFEKVHQIDLRTKFKSMDFQVSTHAIKIKFY